VSIPAKSRIGQIDLFDHLKSSSFHDYVKQINVLTEEDSLKTCPRLLEAKVVANSSKKELQFED